MNVKIENYRGIDILFDTESERFSFTIDEGSWRDKQSYAACKRAIDEYHKSNIEFKPFFIHSISQPKRITEVVGRTKSGRFVQVNDKGVKSQISTYEYDHLFKVDVSNEPIFKEIERHDLEIDKINLLNKTLASQLKKVTLQDVKQTLINNK